MWWKILIAVICGALLISPVDAIPALPFDDIAYALGMVTTLVSTFKGIKPKKNKDVEADINDVNDN